MREAPGRVEGFLRRAHPVIADVGCRNTVFGAEAQEASGHSTTGVALESGFQVGVCHESAEEVAKS